ncbi:DUF1501 domain-containing protein, partial [Burkholderia cepacia]|uniref:DUF1501 domain-containing protein n=1 Tax=Burkholderia cepacia TaxID=292 RepID=UPI001CF2BC11
RAAAALRHAAVVEGVMRRDVQRRRAARHAIHSLRIGVSAMRWLTYAEFGRRVRENQSNGTDHGTAAPHFVMGGRVAGGLYGAPPALGRLDGNGNLPVAVDFRQLYATVLGPWWGLDATRVLQQRFDTLPLLKA